MSDTLCQELKDCGFNSAAVETTQLNAGPTITNCQNHGIKPFLHVAGMEDSVATCQPYVNLYKKATGLGGWMLKSGVTQTQASAGSSLSKAAGFIRANDEYITIKRKVNGKEEIIHYPHPIFMSALSTADFPHQSDNRPKSASEEYYKNYIDAFQDNLQPSFWPFLTFPTVVDSTTFPLQDFYLDLEIFALMARYTNSPMWPYIRCRSETGSGNILPAGTEARLRSAAFSALAYGAQGLVWWTYGPTTTSTGKMVNGLVDGNGNRTALWNIVKAINTQIASYSSVFAGSRLVKCRHTGTTQYGGTCKLKGAFGPLKGITSRSAGVLLSHLCKEGVDYLVIVNHPGAPGQSLTLEFSDYWQVVQTVLSSSGFPMGNPISQTTLSLNLQPGGFLIFSWS